MKPTESSKSPVIELTDKEQVKAQIKSLKAGGRIRVLKGDYILTVGVPSNDEEQANDGVETEAAEKCGWFE